MSRKQLEKIVFGVMIAILSIIAIYTGLLLLFITVPSGVILFTPVQEENIDKNNLFNFYITNLSITYYIDKI